MSDLSLLTALLPSDPSLVPLLRSQSTFTRPSHLATSEVHKFLNKLGSSVCVTITPGNGKSSTNSLSSSSVGGVTAGSSAGRVEWTKRQDAWKVARLVLEMDIEGYVLGGGWGKTWLLNLLGCFNNNAIPPTSIPHLLPLLTLLHTHASLSPTYHRATSTPNLLKTSQSIVSTLKRAVAPQSQAQGQGQGQSVESGSRDPRIILACLIALPHLIAQNPTPHRPLLPTLLPLLHSLLLSPPSIGSGSGGVDKQQRDLAARLLARLHTLSGKVAAGNTFRGDMNGMIRESEGIVTVLFHALYHDRFTVGKVSHGQAQAQQTGAKKGEWAITAVQPVIPGDGSSGTLGDLSRTLESRSKGLMRCLDGWISGILNLLRFETARPVGLALGSLIALGLKCLSLTPETLTEETLDTETRALAIRLKNKIWACGMKLLGGVVIAAGDHVLPNVGLILDKSVFLLETLPKADHSTRIALFKFHALLLSNLQLDPSSSSFHSRLMKQALGSASLVLDTKTPVLASSQGKDAVNDVVGKKGKKRARGAGEEVVVAGIEGRSGKGLSKIEGEVVLSALRLTKVLHHHPSIPPHLLALSVRIHLSIAHTLECKTASAVSQQDLGLTLRLSEVVAQSLEDAMTIEGSGVRQGWIGSIVTQETISSSSVLPMLLHPTAPPLSRPLPPVSTLAYYAVDAEEEEVLRKEIGLRTAEEAEQAVLDLNSGAFETIDGQEDEDFSRAPKRAATGNSNSVTRSSDQPAQSARAVASTTATSVFGTSTPLANAATTEPITSLSRPDVPLSIPPTDSSTVTVVLPPVKVTADTHQPTQVGVKDNADAAAAAMTEPFSSISKNLSARPVDTEGTTETVTIAEAKEDDDDAIPEINVDSDSDEDDDEEMS